MGERAERSEVLRPSRAGHRGSSLVISCAGGRVPQACGQFHWPKNQVKCPHLTTHWGGKAMVSHLLYYQLALCVLAWLFVMLHVTGSNPGLPASPAVAQPKRKSSTEPKACEGLTHKPHCVLCEQEGSVLKVEMAVLDRQSKGKAVNE
jgi:hypothetical protein